MKLILILVMWFLYSIQNIDSRRYRLHPDDELYPYRIDKSVPHVTEYWSLEHYIMEQIDDDHVEVGGYPTCIKSTDPKLPLQFAIQTEFLEQGTWIEGPIRLIIPDFCADAINPSRMWYNVTKLWTNCPPQEGDKWLIESQLIDIQFDFPPSFSIGPWRAYIIFTQGLLGKVTKFGLMLRTELIEVL